MKRVMPPDAEPEMLTEFRKKYPDATWAKRLSGGRRAFKKKKGNQCVFDALSDAQGFVCAYCEIRIGRPDSHDVDGEVEHYVPKSTPGAHNYALDFTNMLACCKGGTPRNARRKDPIDDHKHCGALKSKSHPAGLILDPRALPLAPSIWSYADDGCMTVDVDACNSAGVSLALASSTIANLGLDRGVLQDAREAVFEELNNAVDDVWDDEQIRVHAMAVARKQLSRGPDGQLSAFWSAIRSWTGAVGEEHIASTMGMGTTP